MQFNVAGISFYTKAVQCLEKCVQCSIVLDPMNKFDKDAVKVLVRGVLIGYVPRQRLLELKKFTKMPCNASITIRKFYAGYFAMVTIDKE